MENKIKDAMSVKRDDKPAWEAPLVISVEVMEVMASSCVAPGDASCDGSANPGKDGSCGCSTLGS